MKASNHAKSVVLNLLIASQESIDDFDSFEEFCDWWETLSAADLRDAIHCSAGADGRRDGSIEELKAIYDEMCFPLTFKFVTDSYRNILSSAPGRALMVVEGKFGQFAAVSSSGQLFGMYADPAGRPDPESAYDFDSSAFLEQGCWDGETPEATRLVICLPKLVTYP